MAPRLSHIRSRLRKTMIRTARGALLPVGFAGLVAYASATEDRRSDVEGSFSREHHTWHNGPATGMTHRSSAQRRRMFWLVVCLAGRSQGE